MSEVWVYDIETYPNIFSLVAANGETKELRVFEISDRKDDSKPLRVFLTKLYKAKAEMVGFNNLGFDYPVLHHFLMNRGVSCDELYQKAMEIINSMRDNRFGTSVPQKNVLLKQIDLFKIHHYDNVNKSTSLKLLEFNMRSRTIEDLPFPVGKELTFEEMDVLLHYNKKDVLETYKFYLYSKDAIEMRRTLTKEFGIDCINYNDGKIGKEYFINELEKVMPECCYSKGKFGRKINQTKRDSMDLKDIVFPYIKFERPEFNAVLEWIKRQTITETKGVFSDIEEHLLGDVAKYANLTTKKLKLKQKGALKTNTEERKLVMKQLREELKLDFPDEELVTKLQDDIHGVPEQQEIDELLQLHPSGWVERVLLKSGKPSWEFKWNIAETLNVVVGNIDIVFGLGGIHASVEGSTFESNNDWVIVDYDVASYYPNLFISNRVYPQHLSDKFCDIYQEVYNKRKGYAKGTPQNAVMKLALNSVYGATNDQYSALYDPLATMTTTINGQLSLCMLGEELLKVEGLKLIQFNTDGLTFYTPRKYLDHISKVVEDWEKLTKLEMERALYSKMAIRNVNNYIAVYEGSDNKYKRNGCYEYKIGFLDGEGLDFHQNQSAVVIKKAAFEKIVNNVPIEKTLKSCKNPFDFCLRTKVDRSSKLVSIDSSGKQTVEQNICRYYVSKNGLSLVKMMPPLETSDSDEWRSFNIESGWLVKTCNNIDDFKWDVDYNYYIAEANKLVEGVGIGL